MRQIPTALQTHLNTGATTLCWAWRITRSDGAKFGFTDHDVDIAFDGTTFYAATGFTASQIKESVGLNVDNLDADAAFQSAALTESDLAAGLYDNATVELWRVNWTDTSQLVLVRKGTLGQVKRKEQAFTAELRGLAQRLQENTGRTYGFLCDAQLGDARCGFTLWTASGAVAGAIDGHSFTTSSLGAYADGVFTNGLLTWMTGTNAGAKMEVQRYAGGEIALWHNMPYPIAPGDTFTVSPGCDKLAATCNGWYNNIVNFRGFNRIPGDDILSRYVNAADARLDGTSMFS
jgi:uncharacterized phage protein (TIGR02218 family)